MKNRIVSLLLFGFVIVIASCSNDDATDPIIENAKDVTDCGITIEPLTLLSICVDGTDFALPEETIKFASTFYSKNDNASNTVFSWNIASGSMEILSVENSTEGLIAKSIATIRFNSDYSGNGLIRVDAENETGHASSGHIVELESNQ